MTDSDRRDAMGLALIVGVFILIVVSLDWKGYNTNGLEHLRNHLPDHFLALVAVAAGAFALYYERKLSREFQEQRTKIKQVVESVLTRYIGDWPDHLSEITALLRDARPGEELLIFVDHFGYAHFTRHKLFMEYLAELDEARKRAVKLRIMVHSEDAAKKSLRSQFKDKIGKADEEKNLAQSYHQMFKDLIPKTVLDNYADFEFAVLYVQASFCDRLLVPSEQDRAKITTTKMSEPESVFYWLLRQGDSARSMIFAYSRFSGVGTGYGFRTSDSQLMAIFARDFDKKWDDSNCVWHGNELFPCLEGTKRWVQGKAESPRTSGDGD